MDKNYYTIFERDGYYYYYVYDEFGRRHKRSTGIKVARGYKGKALLQQLLARREMEGTLLTAKDTKHSVKAKFGEYAKDYWNFDTCPYIQEKLARGGFFSKQVSMNYASQLERFIMPVFGSKLLVEITPQMVKDWLMELPKKHNISFHTANTALINIRHILDSAVTDLIIESNPAQKVTQLIHHTEGKKAFTPEQIKKLFEEPWFGDELQYTACYLSAATGMRLGEIRALTVEQVHKDHIEVNASWADKEGRKTTKNGKPRIVPISSKVLYRLQKIMPSKGLIFSYDGLKPLGENSIYNPLFKKMEEIGIDRKKEKLSFHSFRYYANTRLKAAGVPEITVRAILGHSGQIVSEMYDSISLQDCNEALKVQEESV